jgi:hypothetical protein
MITPSDSPSSPSNYAAVPVQPMDIQAASPIAEVTAAFDTSIAEGGSGVLYPMSPRIAEARELLQSPQGYGTGGFSIQSGASHGWPTDVMPPDTVDNGGYGGA